MESGKNLASVIAIRPRAEKQSHINISHRLAPIYTDRKRILASGLAKTRILASGLPQDWTEKRI
jgi:hypothetical protein